MTQRWRWWRSDDADDAALMLMTQRLRWWRSAYAYDAALTLMTMLFLKHPTCWPEVRTTVSIIAAPSEIKIGLAREVTFSADCCSGSVGQSFWICPSVVLDLPALHHVRRYCGGRRPSSSPSGRDGETLVLYFYFAVDSRVSSRILPPKHWRRWLYSLGLSDRI